MSQSAHSSSTTTRWATSLLPVCLLLSCVQSFTVVPRQQQQHTSSSSSLSMGLFDGVKDAFSAPTLERSKIDAERETPIDRWMGWSVASDAQNASPQTPISKDFCDSMDATNYVTVELTKPMGIVFEENDAEFGGIFVHSMKDDGAAAATDGQVKVGDQLVGVEQQKVSGLPFDDALGAIIEATAPQVKLLFFRGKADQLYGPTGASQAWLDDFIGVVVEEKQPAEEETPATAETSKDS